MSIIKCKMCGGDLNIAENVTVAECEYCGTKQTVPTSKDESLQGLFNRANTLRLKSEFDRAESLYDKIIQSDETQAEAYWGLILCKYGIEYVEDPTTFKRIPTCHRASFDSVVADDDYKSALKYADAVQKSIYEEQANEIDRIQKEILALSQKEETYDVFICYKETDDAGKRTQDSVIANDIYHQLTQEGFKVFYAAITLENKLGSAYEPCIFAALNSAKVMLAIGTKPEHFNAVWVKNEWSRFLKIIKKDSSKLLIPCYRDMDAYKLPDEFAHLQAQDMSKIGFIQDLIRGIKKISKSQGVKSETKTEQESSDVKELALPDGGLYFGDSFAGKPHGTGKCIYESGDSYEGEWAFGKYSGRGTKIFANGTKYECEWKNGKANGKGTMIYNDGGIWEGNFVDGIVCNGNGKIKFSNGDIYDGELKDRKRNGKGTMIWNDGGIWKGEFKDNDPWNGNGKFIYYNDGYTYEGEWKDGKKNGKCKIIWNDGGIWEGESKDDYLWDGNGKVKYSDGGIYEGEWKEGKRNGKGKIIWNDGGIWEGEFKDDDFWNGNGKLIYSDGSIYEGEWKYGKRKGQGKYTYKDGFVLRGEWIDDKKSGCYIATAVYGSYDCPEVWTLRRYRDYALASTWYGRAFIHTYYAISPTLVKWFGKTNWFRKLWKEKLDYIVKVLHNKGFESTPYNDKY